jgi:hypothetical protein
MREVRRGLVLKIGRSFGFVGFYEAIDDANDAVHERDLAVHFDRCTDIECEISFSFIVVLLCESLRSLP